LISTACAIIFKDVPDTHPDKVSVASSTHMQNGTSQRISSVIALKLKSFLKALEVKYNERKKKYSLRVYMFYLH
jgi:hypothetical protein